MYMYTYIYIYVYVLLYIYMIIYVRMCIYNYIYIYICLHTYIFSYMQGITLYRNEPQWVASFPACAMICFHPRKWEGKKKKYTETIILG